MLPLLLLAAMAAGGFYLYEKPFESTRPPAEELDTSFASEAESVPARLWEDPFTAVAEHLKAKPPSEDGDIGQATDAARERERASANSEDSCDQEPSSGHDLSWLVKQICDTRKHNPVTVMPVMVRGGWYGEDIEQRRRRRYAVLSALGAEGYQPRHSDRVSYLFLPKPEESPLFAREPKAFVPYEWFNPDRTGFVRDLNLDEQPRVLVMWVAEDMFDKPLSGLANLLSGLNVAVQKVGSEAPLKSMHLKIIGPSSSQVLQRMMWEASLEGTDRDDISKQFDELSQGPVEMYSPTATAEEDILIGATLDSPHPTSEDPSSGKGQSMGECRSAEDSQVRSDGRSKEKLQSIEAYFGQVHISFLRANAGDEQLAETILCDEFARRRIFVHDPHHVVVLLSEWDTFYGRALPKSFANVLLEERQLYEGIIEDNGSPDEVCRSGICQYSYLRGLDGETPQSKPKEAGVGTSGASKETAPDPESLERADGESQYDYLRRLAHKIEADVGDTNVKAIGVLATDVHDKLLVLQALHDRFPRALFFTTDLDARYTHASAYPFTRNLVVASGFELESESKGDIETPPFRDSYQSATFHAVRRALAEAEDSKPSFEPKLFEIGRDKVFQLDEKEQSRIEKTLFFWSWFVQPFYDMRAYASYTSRSDEKAQGASNPGLDSIVFSEMTFGLGGIYQQLGVHIAEFAGAPLMLKFEIGAHSLLALWLDAGDLAAITLPGLGGMHQLLGVNDSEFAYAPLSLKLESAARSLAALWIISALLLIVFVVRAKRDLEAMTRLVRWSRIGLLLVVPSSVLLSLVWLMPTEEPLAWWGGVSIWPAEAIRLFACTLSIALFVHSRRWLARNATGLDGRYVLWGQRECDRYRRDVFLQPQLSPPSKRNYLGKRKRRALLERVLLPFGSAETQKGLVVTKTGDYKSYINVCGLWREYIDIHPELMFAKGAAITEAQASSSAWWRVVPLAVFIAAALVIIQLASSNLSARGTAAYVLDKGILALAAVAFTVLLLYVLETTLMCRRFITHLVRRVSDYPQQTLNKFADEHKLTVRERPTDLADWLDVQLIANRTRAVSALIYGPLIILALLWVSYSHIFDGWHRPPMLYLFLLIPAVLVVGSQIALRNEAEKGRRRALDRMDHKLSGAHAADDKGRIEQLKLLIDEIKTTQDGAFRPLSQQPFLRAMLLPFAGIGGIQALDYLSMLSG
ncbi:MAG: hypothetical protein ACREVE_00880 [Gammaproteobacteria bacterium]